jgi:flagellin-like protein
MVPSSKKVRRAVSPVLATLMMVAVAVALSVIIFTWSQGFLSQTGEAASGQQAQQNIAAQSGILIQAVSTQAWNGEQDGVITISIRNAGAVSTTLSTIYITPPAAGNTGLTKSLMIKWDSTTTVWDEIDPTTGSVITTGVTATPDTAPSITPRGSYTLTITFDASDAPAGYKPATGDVFTVKATTTVGTFTQGTYTVA